jgi:Flp pilus assembly protein CpaB
MATTTATPPRSERMGRVFLVLALGIGLLAAALAVIALSDGGSGSEESAVVTTVTRVVAADDIPARTRISPAMLRLEEVPISAVLEGSYIDVERVDGLVARYPIAAREQVTTHKVGATFNDLEATAGLSFVVPAGLRAVSIEVNEFNAVGGLVVAGDRVDVIAIFDEEIAGIEKAVTILQDVEVGAVAQSAQRPVPPPSTEGETTEDASTRSSSGLRPEEIEANPSLRTVTLLVSPDDAQLLALAGFEAELWLTLRGFEDSEQLTLVERDLLEVGVLPPSLRP